MEEKYVILEIQTQADGTVTTLVNDFNNIDAAYNKYYTVLAYAAVSNVARHAASLLSNDGTVYESKYFEHPLLEEE